jgi:transposase
MQKVLTQMNVQLANVIRDLSGLTEQTIVRAILAGERDPKKLAELSHPQIRASRQEIAKSLEGNWHPELLFVLKQEMEMYDIYQRRIAECDKELEGHLKSFADNEPSKLTEEEPRSEQQQGKKVRTPERTKLTPRGKKATGNPPR